MSDHPLPDDELLSSHLDGELTVDERDRLDGRLDAEPALRNRLAAVGAARDLTRTPVGALAPVDADRIIAAALDASDTAANVTDLGVGGARQRPWHPRLAAVAAAAVAVALTVPALRAIDGNDDADDMAATADIDTATFDDATFDDAGGADRDAADVDPATDVSAGMAPLADEPPGEDAATDGAVGGDEPDGTETTASPGPEVLVLFAESATFDPLVDELGGFESADALSAAIGDALAAARDTPLTTTAPSLPLDDEGSENPDAAFATAVARFDGFTIPPCTGLVEAVIDRFAGEPVIAADYAAALVQGAPVTVGVFQRTDGSTEFVVIDQATCVLRRVPLE